MASFESRNGKLYIDGKEVLKGFESFSGWYWFATEKVGTQDSVIDGKVYKDDTIWFGFVQGHVEEWGNFSEGELMSLAPKVWEISRRNLPYSGRRRQEGEVDSPGSARPEQLSATETADNTSWDLTTPWSQNTPGFSDLWG